ncbi:hypothetical protein IGM_06743 [Bacillus cereus HuB4-4]|uniref:Uncharacterized protein n=1 Tax=Bacillus cereus HuB4-4 TaxID=1053211 RepID=A0A9W5QMP7_BACCE|nr:hypothetical protein IGM_06743 [Bacillus cereus HuB4-4]
MSLSTPYPPLGPVPLTNMFIMNLFFVISGHIKIAQLLKLRFVFANYDLRILTMPKIRKENSLYILIMLYQSA